MVKEVIFSVKWVCLVTFGNRVSSRRERGMRD